MILEALEPLCSDGWLTSFAVIGGITDSMIESSQFFI